VVASTPATTQSYFSDELSDAVFAARPPYSTRGQRLTRNTNGGIFGSTGRNEGGSINVEEEGGGYAGSIIIGIAA
jgi:hypothetical protein